MNNNSGQRYISRGYIAVVSALILSAIITGIVFVESTSTFWTRDDESNEEASIHSQALATSCIYSALLEYEKNHSAIGTSTKVVINPNSPDSACVIDSILQGTNAITITTHAEFHTAYAGYIVTASSSLSSGIMSITSWRDITSTPP